MKKRVLALLFLLPLPLCSYEILPSDSLRVGMKGYGISVFEANTIDTFGVEILGVLNNIGPGRKLIVARLSGAGLEKTGIIAGMSGSPAFINGKIIGAVAYGWTFALEPIAGITPIEEILETKMDSAEAIGNGMEIKLPGEGRLSPYSGVTLSRIQTPLVISGFDGVFVEQLDDFFKDKGFSVVLGGVSGGGSDDDTLFVGSPVSAQLVNGDASIGAVGTVTYIDGNDVFAFGHPLFHSGSVSFPMTTADVIAIMPSQYSSFKIANATNEVGAVIQDRDDAIYGVIGEKAKTIPVEITVRKGKASRTYSFEVVDHDELTAYFSSMVFGNSVIAQGRAFGSLSIDLSASLKLGSYDDLELRNYFSGDLALTHAMNDVSDMIRLLMNDRFSRIEIEGMNLDVRITEETRTAVIENAKPSSFTVKRGDDIDVTVIMRDFDGGLVNKKCAVHIPKTYTDSIARIALVGSQGMINLESERAANRFIAERPGHILELMKASPRNNVLYCLLLSLKPGLIVKGYELSTLPSSMLHLMQESQNLGEGRFTQGGIVSTLEVECDFVVSGSRVITLKVID